MTSGSEEKARKKYFGEEIERNHLGNIAPTTFLNQYGRFIGLKGGMDKKDCVCDPCECFRRSDMPPPQPPPQVQPPIPQICGCGAPNCIRKPIIASRTPSVRPSTAPSTRPPSTRTSTVPGTPSASCSVPIACSATQSERPSTVNNMSAIASARSSRREPCPQQTCPCGAPNCSHRPSVIAPPPQTTPAAICSDIRSVGVSVVVAESNASGGPARSSGEPSSKTAVGQVRTSATASIITSVTSATANSQPMIGSTNQSDVPSRRSSKSPSTTQTASAVASAPGSGRQSIVEDPSGMPPSGSSTVRPSTPQRTSISSGAPPARMSQMPSAMRKSAEKVCSCSLQVVCKAKCQEQKLLAHQVPSVRISTAPPERYSDLPMGPVSAQAMPVDESNIGEPPISEDETVISSAVQSTNVIIVADDGRSVEVVQSERTSYIVQSETMPSQLAVIAEVPEPRYSEQVTPAASIASGLPPECVICAPACAAEAAAVRMAALSQQQVPATISSCVPSVTEERRMSARMSAEPSARASAVPSARVSAEASARVSAEPSARGSTEVSARYSADPSVRASAEPSARATRTPSAQSSARASAVIASSHPSARMSAVPSEGIRLSPLPQTCICPPVENCPMYQPPPEPQYYEEPRTSSPSVINAIVVQVGADGRPVRVNGRGFILLATLPDGTQIVMPPLRNM